MYNTSLNIEILGGSTPDEIAHPACLKGASLRYPRLVGGEDWGYRSAIFVQDQLQVDCRFPQTSSLLSLRLLNQNLVVSCHAFNQYIIQGDTRVIVKKK